MSDTKRILFLTNSEYGQANVVLAVAHALMHAAADVEIHIASFEILGKAVRLLSDYALQTAPSPQRSKGIVFHTVLGQPYSRTPLTRETFDLTPSLYNTARTILAFPEAMSPWEPEEFVGLCEEVERIIDEVQPDLVVVEPMFNPGLTICHYRRMKWMVLCPNTIKDLVVPMQPALAVLWKYPM